MNLFEPLADDSGRESARPLPERMRPRTADEVVGQQHLIGPGKPLRRQIEADELGSMILWGPPGVGKTSLARVIANSTQCEFVAFSGVLSSIKDVKAVLVDARRMRKAGRRTIVFVDEIHRFNKAQQDVILPHVEDGTITFVGATTENPSFEVNAPLLSRCRVFTLHALDEEAMTGIVERALSDEDRGLGLLAPELESDAVAHLVNIANGDARVVLNALEMAVVAAEPGEDGVRRIDMEAISDALQRRTPQYDKAGDSHYDTISAFIKSVRGSSPDGALYWLARMLEAGEDPLFIARRLVILAAEDIGLANPGALPVAVAAQQAVHFIGLPEGRIPLAEATVYLATSPKSNAAYVALGRATADVRDSPHEPVPLHLRNAVTGLMRGMGYGKDYKYSHDFEGNFEEQEYLPPGLAGRRYYEASDQGSEAAIAERLRRWWGEKD